MKKSYIVFGLVAAIALGGLYFYQLPNSSYQQPTTPATTPTSQQQATAPAVSIANFAFQPTPLTVVRSATVTWTNNDSMPHTVTADDGSFDSKSIAPGSTFSHTFTTVGTVAYHCTFHGSMHGSVIVTK